MADKLFCPRCSNQFSDGTSYCRNCGLSLDAVSKIVKGEAENAPQITTENQPVCSVTESTTRRLRQSD